VPLQTDSCPGHRAAAVERQQLLWAVPASALLRAATRSRFHPSIPSTRISRGGARKLCCVCGSPCSCVSPCALWPPFVCCAPREPPHRGRRSNDGALFFCRKPTARRLAAIFCALWSKAHWHRRPCVWSHLPQQLFSRAKQAQCAQQSSGVTVQFLGASPINPRPEEEWSATVPATLLCSSSAGAVEAAAHQKRR